MFLCQVSLSRPLNFILNHSARDWSQGKRSCCGLMKLEPCTDSRVPSIIAVVCTSPKAVEGIRRRDNGSPMCVSTASIDIRNPSPINGPLKVYLSSFRVWSIQIGMSVTFEFRLGDCTKPRCCLSPTNPARLQQYMARFGLAWLTTTYIR